MGIEQLEKTEMATLYWVQESQNIVEHDSPAIGATQKIAQRESVYEFFHSEEEAKKYIAALEKEFMQKNSTLRKINSGLEGTCNHAYAHYFEINHKVENKQVPVNELGIDISDLLSSPQKRVLKDDPTFERGWRLGDQKESYDFSNQLF